MQSKRMSLIETLVSTAIGYLVAVATQAAVFPLFGLYVPLQDNLMIGGIFTVVSIVRGYLVRRAFNRL
jgi:exosome complex RNA-binding protein Rrp4